MITFKERLGLIRPYVQKKLLEQIKAVAVIMVYLVFFQAIVLGIPISNAASIAFGLSLVVVGLAFFMEGLVLGLMPLGEVIGLKLPQKSKLPLILSFSFVLGVGATFAEPAISVLKAAGSSVKAWEAPLLYLLLNKYSHILVYSVGVGVGAAVVFGMMRFMYQWSLKPFIYVLVGGVVALSAVSYFDPNMLQLAGLAWDCGALTTGPVTVPLVLALGIGISRVVGGGDSESGGFGVVTLASLFPILTVLLLGLTFLSEVPEPSSRADFFKQSSPKKSENLFESRAQFAGYVFNNGSYEDQLSVFKNDKKEMLAALSEMSKNPQKEKASFGNNSIKDWAVNKGNIEQQIAVFGSKEKASAYRNEDRQTSTVNPLDLIKSQTLAALQAIIPLSLFLMLTLWIALREGLPQKDEIFLGIVFATVGMAIFNIGIELGLSKMGNQVGSVLPSSYKKIELTNEAKTISEFDEKILQTAINSSGETVPFFYSQEKSEIRPVTYAEKNHNKESQSYTYSPTRGPLFGGEDDLSGILVVLLFAFFMGYGATLAEPALNALGSTVETITVGNFKKNLLMQSVALGVGVGIMLGVSKIIWNIPLIFMLGPPYVALIIISYLSTEEFVNIGWDSAGVTTGPITVPLVLAMGLGIGAQAGVVEGFGILAMASVCPILSVLSVGLYVTAKRKKDSKNQPIENISNEDHHPPQLKSA